MIKEAILKLVQAKKLSFSETKQVFNEIFDNDITPAQIAAFLVSLKMKGEAEDEIAAAATVIRERANKLNIREDFLGIERTDEPIMDTCGTGGSGLNKFNISTATAFVISASGVKVAKHGNRAMSSSCGSADVLESLGVNISAPLTIMEKAVRELGIGFLYAPLYHPALAQVAKIRREMGIRTIFNILGPLCNPANASHQLLGVYSPNLTTILAKVLKRLGVKKAFVVCGKDLLDEVSLTGPTKVAFLNRTKITNISLNPASFGLKKIRLKDLFVKDKKESARLIKDILKGKKCPGRDIVLANASVCFYILGKAVNFKEGVRIAASLIDKGKANEKLLTFKKFLDKNA